VILVGKLIIKIITHRFKIIPFRSIDSVTMTWIAEIKVIVKEKSAKNVFLAVNYLIGNHRRTTKLTALKLNRIVEIKIAFLGRLSYIFHSLNSLIEHF
jgi:hypothetical protein